MKSPQYIALSAILACFVTSCACNSDYWTYTSADLTPASGYHPKDAYERGFSDGSLDRRRGLAHNPHINEDASTLPSAHRLEYTWGYIEGYRNPSMRYRSGSSK